MTTTAQMTSATYLPAGCKRVKLNLANAYRTTYTHLVVGDDIRVRITSWGLDPAATVAPKNSFWARVSKVERGTGYVQIWVSFGTEERAVRWTAAHTAVTRKERATEYSARLMLAEQEREASLKASAAELERKRAVASIPLEEPAKLAADMVKISREGGEADPATHAMRVIEDLTTSAVPEVQAYYRLVYAELMSLADRARRLACGVQGHDHVTLLAAASCRNAQAVARVQAGGTWDTPPVVHAFNHDPKMASSAAACGGQGWRGPASEVTCPECKALPVITAGARVHFADFLGDTFTVAFTYGDMGKQYAELVADSGDRIREARWEDLTLAARQDDKREHELAAIYAGESVHDYQPSPFDQCARIVARPNGTTDVCGEPIKSAIHDPAAYSAYATELALELKKWADPTGAELDRALEIAFPSIPAQRKVDDARMIAEVAYARGGQPAQELADMRVRATEAEAKLELMRSTMTSLAQEARRRAENWVPEHNLTSLELEAKADLLDVLLRLLDS